MMNDLKQRLISVMDEIQFQAELKMYSLEALAHMPQANSFKAIYSQYILNKLELTHEALLSVGAVDEFEEALNNTEADYHSLFEIIDKQIERVKNREDISDYLFQLKQESKELSVCFIEKIKRLLKRRG